MVHLIQFTLAIPIAVWRGYVLSVLWAWFISGTFGVPLLNIPQALGLSIIVGMLTDQANEHEEPSSAPFLLAAGLINPTLFLAIGWVVTKFL